MIRSFGIYDPSIEYTKRDGSYLLHVSDNFLVPVVKTPKGYYLVGGEVESVDVSPLACLQREIMEEIGARSDKYVHICETETYFYSEEFDDMRHSHNWFYFAENLVFCTKQHESIPLCWMTFQEAMTKLTLEHQRWALSFFRSVLKSITHNRKVLDSITFVDGLACGNGSMVKRTPKSDLHNHIVFGSNREEFYKLTETDISPLFTPVESFADFVAWCDNHISTRFKSKEGFLLRVEAALITAAKDNIVKLCLNIGVCSMKHFSSVDDLLANIRLLQEKHFSGRILLLELCLDRNKIYDRQYRQWYYDLLSTNEFYSLDTTGDESKPIDELIPMYRKAEACGLLLKAHIGEYADAEQVVRTAELLHLDEIQHGNMLAGKEKELEWIRTKSIVLNMAPSSNYLLSRVTSIADHPIQQFYRSGIKVTINSDDILVFGNTVTDEYIALYKNNVLNAEELNQIRIQGLDIPVGKTDNL